MVTNTAKIDVEAQFTALCTSLQGLSDAESIILNGKPYKKAELISTFQGCLTAIATTKAARTQWLAATANEKAVRAAVRPIRAGLKSYLDARLGKANPDLATFGFKPAKPVQKTVQVKTAAVEKAAATRQARQTKGSKQKKAVKGDVVGITVTPVTAQGPVVAKAPASPTPGTTSPGTTAGPATHNAT